MSVVVQGDYQSVALFLEGELIGSANDRTVEVVNPSTGRCCGSIPAGSDSDVDRAVASARSAFEDGRWRHLSPASKKKALHTFADLIDADATHLDALDAGEMGKPISVAFCNAVAAAGLMRFYAEAVDKLTGDVYASDKDSLVVQRRVPRGVIAAVVPWNFPTFVAALKLAPALAAGNSIVLKPSELSSRSSMRLASLAVRAGIPPGVMNVVPGLGPIVGRALGLHPDVDMLSFTGSTDVGKKVLEYAAQSNMKVVLAECGGKSPQIVFDDGVDLDAASKSIARFLITNQGQICSVGSRLLVQRSIESELIRKLRPWLDEIVIGDPLDPTTTFGPIASAKQCDRVMGYIHGAAADGAELVVGGRKIMQETGGYFVEPTVFRGVAPSARIAREEIFGPVLSVIPFEDEAEAIRIANETGYGLAAYVWTNNLSRGMRMMKGIRSSVRINAAASMGEGAQYASSNEPAGQSGIGTEGGLAGMEGYLRRQRVWFNHA